jgi:hypothetical protein
MGMYDTINATAYREKLPECPPDLDLRYLQTKDAGCFLADFEITEDGALKLVQADTCFGGEEFGDGELRMYTNGPDDKWWEWMMILKDNKIISAERVKLCNEHGYYSGSACEGCSAIAAGSRDFDGAEIVGYECKL